MKEAFDQINTPSSKLARIVKVLIYTLQEIVRDLPDINHKYAAYERIGERIENIKEEMLFRPKAKEENTRILNILQSSQRSTYLSLFPNDTINDLRDWAIEQAQGAELKISEKKLDFFMHTFLFEHRNEIHFDITFQELLGFHGLMDAFLQNFI